MMPSERTPGDPRSCRRFLAMLAAAIALPSVALATAVIAIDPYYVFGAPDWPGVNDVRPQYETHVIVAKPYQVARLRPEGVSFGSSTAEVGIDPRHPGWRTTRVFNFALPSSNSYTVMLAFLHAQAHGMKRAVIGLDFFAYNIFGPVALDVWEDRFTDWATMQEFANLLATKPKAPASRPAPEADDRAWDEALYRVVNPDVAAAIRQGMFASGREHFERVGRNEGRVGGVIEPGWNEAGYLQAHPDVALAVKEGRFRSGYHHFLVAGRTERRWGGWLPPSWDEERYLAQNPGARARMALNGFASGYVHYALYGRNQGMLGGFPASDPIERLQSAWPSLHRAVGIANEIFRFIFSTSAAADSMATVRSQNVPASFDSLGMRVWRGQDAVIRKFGGGAGRMFDRRLRDGRWAPWLFQPKFMFCFAYSDGGVSTFDPYRFMLRKAYAAGTDVHLFTTPLNVAMREVLTELGLGDRYEYWLKELTAINEQEAARAGRAPFALWDFSDANAVTRESFPVATDPSPMRWFWEYSHYRKEAGDLILDRMFGYNDAGRTVPPDFGVRLTGATVDAHLTRSRERQADWGKVEGAMQETIQRFVRDPRTANHQFEASCW